MQPPPSCLQWVSSYPTSGRSARSSRLSLGHGYPYCRWHWGKPTEDMLQWSILLSKIISLDPRRQTDSETEYIWARAGGNGSFFGVSSSRFASEHELVVLDTEVRTLSDFIARPIASLSTTSPVSASTSCCLSRLPVFLLMRWNETRTRRRRIERDRAGHERQLEVALPVGACGHATVLTQQTPGRLALYPEPLRL